MVSNSCTLGIGCINQQSNPSADTVKEGEVVYESPEAGEVIWRDDQGVTCCRWNWRQGVRTRLDASARQMWFILESLPAMPLSALQQASDELACCSR